MAIVSILDRKKIMELSKDKQFYGRAPHKARTLEDYTTSKTNHQKKKFKTCFIKEDSKETYISQSQPNK